jgi:hypothetical protein
VRVQRPQPTTPIGRTLGAISWLGIQLAVSLILSSDTDDSSGTYVPLAQEERLRHDHSFEHFDAGFASGGVLLGGADVASTDSTVLETNSLCGLGVYEFGADHEPDPLYWNLAPCIMDDTLSLV